MAAPIAIFAYNRADKLASLLTSLRECRGIQEAQVTVFIDGPRTPQDAEGVRATRGVAERFSGKNWDIRSRTDNIGLRKAISSGVTEIVARDGRVIVLEDDLILSSGCIEYFNAALDKYEKCDRVWSISAYMYDTPRLKDRKEAFFLPFAHPWGWATWSRAWEQFDPHLAPRHSDLNSKAFRDAFNLHGLRNFSSMLDMANQGLVNSWFIRWYYAIFTARAVSVFPPVPYVSNVGVSGGTHASRLNPHGIFTKSGPLAVDLVEFPTETDVDYEALDYIISSSDARVQRITSELGRAKRHGRNLLSRI